MGKNMNKKIIAAIVAAATVLSVMGCSDEDFEETVEQTETVSSENGSADISFDDPSGDFSLEDDLEESGESTTASADTTAAQTADTNSTANTQAPSYILGEVIKAEAENTDSAYENAFLNLKMNVPKTIWFDGDDYKADKINTSVNEFPSAALKLIESGKPVLAQIGNLDMDTFKVTIVKGGDYSKEKYFEESTNIYKTTNGDTPPQNVSSEVRSITFLGEKTDVLTMKGTLVDENYIANYLYYSKDGYSYMFELSGFGDYINYFEEATTLN